MAPYKRARLGGRSQVRLQTEPYTRYQFTEAGVKDIEGQVAARLVRQQILSREPLVWVLLDQAVIDRPTGGREVMREQLARLLEMSALQHVSVRVVPRSVGWHHGLAGAFKVMTVGASDVAYTEANGGARLALGAAECRGVRDTVRQDRRYGPPEDSSRRLITEVMEAMR